MVVYIAFKILNKFISVMKNWLSREYFDRKPCCTGVKILFLEKMGFNWFTNYVLDYFGTNM